MLNFFPKYFTNRAIFLYVAVLIIVSLIFFEHILPFTWWIFGFVEVIGFFYFSNLLTKKWSEIPAKIFVKRLFTTALIVRVVWVIVSYLLYTFWTGIPFEWEAADARAYHELGIWLNALIKQENVKPFFDHFKGSYSDTGYATFLGFQYYLTGDSIIIARIVKAIFGALISVFSYKLASRNFGESTGRMAGIFTMLMPSLIYYTGLHLKETEMVFLLVWFIERADDLIRNKKFKFNTLWLPILLAVLLFFFRTVLGVAAIFALLTAIFLSTERIVKFGKRFLLGIWIVIAIFFFLGTQYSNEIGLVWKDRDTNQAQSMQSRSIVQKGKGNKFSKYATTAVFAPLIFIIPLPTMVNVESQKNQMLMNGSNFVKNVMAFFVIFALIWMIKERKMREYLLITSFVISYLAIIAMSAFAHSERFHQPVIPFLLILAAFGISKVSNKHKFFFTLFILFILAAIIGWNWFKLTGKGMI